jgi:hypothetical protein
MPRRRRGWLDWLPELILVVLVLGLALAGAVHAFLAQ